jgi:hypothetical protein
MRSDSTIQASECILVCKPYSTGNYYFAPVDYQGGTQYANLEIEIANYHINNIMNGLAPSMLINFNNGQPPAEVKDMIEAQIQTKFSGSQMRVNSYFHLTITPKLKQTLHPFS